MQLAYQYLNVYFYGIMDELGLSYSQVYFLTLLSYLQVGIFDVLRMFGSGLGGARKKRMRPASLRKVCSQNAAFYGVLSILGFCSFFCSICRV